MQIELTPRLMIALVIAAALAVAIIIAHAPDAPITAVSTVRPTPMTPPECARMEAMDREFAAASREWYRLEPSWTAGTLTTDQKIRMVELQSTFERLTAIRTAYRIQNAAILSKCP